MTEQILLPLQAVVFKGDQTIEDEFKLSWQSVRTNDDAARAFMYYLRQRYNNAARVYNDKRKSAIYSELLKRGDAYKEYALITDIRALDVNGDNLTVHTSSGDFA